MSEHNSALRQFGIENKARKRPTYVYRYYRNCRKRRFVSFRSFRVVDTNGPGELNRSFSTQHVNRGKSPFLFPSFRNLARRRKRVPFVSHTQPPLIRSNNTTNRGSGIAVDYPSALFCGSRTDCGEKIARASRRCVIAFTSRHFRAHVHVFRHFFRIGGTRRNTN